MTVFRVQVWHGNKYRTVHEGTNKDRALIQASKSYIIKYYKTIRIIKVSEEVIYKWRSK